MTEAQRLLLEVRLRRSKSRLQEIEAVALARAGKRVLIVRPDGHTVILPFKRPAGE